MILFQETRKLFCNHDILSKIEHCWSQSEKIYSFYFHVCLGRMGTRVACWVSWIRYRPFNIEIGVWFLCSRYDQTLFEDDNKNRMMETKELFEWVLKQPCFEVFITWYVLSGLGTFYTKDMFANLEVSPLNPFPMLAENIIHAILKQVRCIWDKGSKSKIVSGIVKLFIFDCTLRFYWQFVFVGSVKCMRVVQRLPTSFNRQTRDWACIWVSISLFNC